jgi:macrodomain Ter protein organizer (MatP/YcbG family)
MEDRLITFYKHTVFWPERNFMNTDKYKSVTVPLNTWKDLKKLADKDLRSISNQIVWLVNKHKEKKNG